MQKLFTQYPITVFAALAYLFSWLFWLIGIANGDGTPAGMWAMLFIGSFGPSLAGVVMTAITQGKNGVKTLLERVIKVKFALGCWLALILLLPILWAAGFYIAGFESVEADKTSLAYVTILIASLNALFGIFLGAGPVGEELGWRGFMLPRLLEKMSVTKTNIVLGLVWAFWHLPLILALPAFRNEIEISIYLVAYPVMAIAASALFTVFWQWSSGSIFVAIFLHSLINVLLSYSGNAIWQEHLSPVVTFAVVTAIIALASLVAAVLSRKKRALFTHQENALEKAK